MSTLAYVFWHCRRSDVGEIKYEALLATFHRALNANRAPGFGGSRVFQLTSVPWLPAEFPVYEDWYFLDDSSAMDRLNDAAITGPRHDPHGQIAGRAAAGAAGLYRLRSGPAYVPSPEQAFWFGKPRGESYEDFYRRLDDQPATFTLWRRQMVLGPTPEFCWHGSVVPEWLERFEGVKRELKLVWTSGPALE